MLVAKDVFWNLPPGFEMSKTVKRIPDACCRAICQVRRPNHKGEVEKLVLILGMYTVDGYTIHVEIPFSDFAPNFTKAADFEKLAFAQLHNRLTEKDTEMHLWRNFDSQCDFRARVFPNGTLVLYINDMFSVSTHSEFAKPGERYRTRSHAEILFSDFTEGFACVADFERLPIVASFKQSLIG